jgi:hypothetical protein
MSVLQIVGPCSRWRPAADRFPPPADLARRFRVARLLCARRSVGMLPRPPRAVVKRHSVGVSRYGASRLERWADGRWPAWLR